MNCPHCFQALARTTAFCPYCGARLGERGTLTAVDGADDPTYGPLARANLQRLRGDWDGARETAVAVLREYPNSGAAHSLMGDIYADQQQHEEAAQWYRMALDLEPDNPADARKLATAESHLRERDADAEAEPAGPRFSGFRVAALAAGLFLVSVIGVGLWVSGMGAASRPSMPPQSQPRSVPGVSAPGIPGPSPAQRPEPRTYPPAPEPSAAPDPRTEREAALAQSLAPMEADMRRAGLRLSGVLVDPRTEHITLTLDGADVNGSDPAWMERAYEAARACAASALEADTSGRGVVARLAMPLAHDATVRRDVAFVGEMTRRPEGGAPADFHLRWWHDGLRPPRALATPSP